MMEWTKKKKEKEERLLGRRNTRRRREKFEMSVRNYSVRTTFKYPSSDRKISEVTGRTQEDGGKTSGRRAKKKKRIWGSKGRRRSRRRRGYNSAGGLPKLVSRSGNVSRARVRDTCSHDDYPTRDDDFISAAKLRPRRFTFSQFSSVDNRLRGQRDFTHSVVIREQHFAYPRVNFFVF